MRQHAICPNPDEIAKTVLAQFDALPARYKPRTLAQGKREWVPLAGIVVVTGMSSLIVAVLLFTTQDHDGSKETGSGSSPSRLQCISLATGMKCLPREKVHAANGNIIHDWHAEVLAIRGFNRWVIDECTVLADGGESQWLQWKSGDTQALDPSMARSGVLVSNLFRLRPGVDVHMYVSSAPCGDASMELVMASQSDATPWQAPVPSATHDEMPGRAHFDQLGIVRRKPSRPDAPSTWSKSCSDKLSMKQCTGLLSGHSSKLVDPVYLKTLILPADELVPSAVQRCFSETGRMQSLSQEDVLHSWKLAGYAFRPFEINSTQHKFAYNKIPGAASSNIAALWTLQQREVLVNGVLMGRKQHDSRGASCVSRRRMWQALEAVVDTLTVEAPFGRSYGEFKQDASRAKVKNDVKRLALHGWRRNDGDDQWQLE